MSRWARRRQFIYFASAVLVVIVIVTAVVYVYWPRPSCFDNKKNQDELGVDCGGSCLLACSEQISPLSVQWTRLAELKTGRYDVAVLIENGNAEYGARKLKYTVRLADKEGILLTAKKGETYLNPGEKFVVFEGNVGTGYRQATKAFVDLETDQLVWEKLTVSSPKIHVGQKNFTNQPFPKLRVWVANNSLNDLRDITFAAVLSDSDKNMIGVSETIIADFRRGDEKEIVFTWPESFTQDPTFIDIYPRLNLFKLR